MSVLRRLGRAFAIQRGSKPCLLAIVVVSEKELHSDYAGARRTGLGDIDDPCGKIERFVRFWKTEEDTDRFPRPQPVDIIPGNAAGNSRFAQVEHGRRGQARVRVAACTNFDLDGSAQETARTSPPLIHAGPNRSGIVHRLIFSHLATGVGSWPQKEP